MPFIQELITLALKEDIGLGDITTDAVVDPGEMGIAVIVAKETLTVSGIDLIRRVFHSLDASLNCHAHVKDGDTVAKGDTLATLEGNLHILLKGERTALNFLQRLSGITTHVRQYVAELDAFPHVRLVDTRKTIPGWRELEKYAVRIGGGHNHRMALYDGVLIKDNHIAACGSISTAVRNVRKRVSHLLKVEVETSTMAEVQEALDAGVEVIMLDNMDLPQIKEAVKRIDGHALVEVSGQVTRESLGSLAKTGVDIISCGALTHQARAVDISMRIQMTRA